MLQQQTELRKAKATPEREARIAEIMREMTIDVDVFDNPFASIRNSKGNDYHIVTIDEMTMTATKCTCDGYCKGRYYCVCMEAVDRFFEKIYASLHREASEVVELVPVEEAMEEAQAEMKEHELDAAYAQLANDPTASIRAVLADREAHDAAGITSDYITASMNDPEKLAAQKGEITRERQRDLGERGNLNRGSFAGVLLNK